MRRSHSTVESTLFITLAKHPGLPLWRSGSATGSRVKGSEGLSSAESQGVFKAAEGAREVEEKVTWVWRVREVAMSERESFAESREQLNLVSVF